MNAVALLRRARRGLLGPRIVALLILPLGSSLSAQDDSVGPLAEGWTVSAMGGRFSYEPSGDANFPSFGVRADSPISEYARFEVETWYSRPDVQQDENFLYDPSLPTESANLFGFTVGVQLRYPLGPFEPYGGGSGGLFARVDDDSGGQRFSRNTFMFPFGFRLWVSDQFGIRAEYRFREDTHQGLTVSDNEISGGVFWTF